MQRVGQACQVPMVRTGVGRQTALVIVGVLGVASILRKVKRGRRRRARVDYSTASAARRTEAEASDVTRDWASEASSIQPASIGEGDLLLLDETLPVTPKQLWKLIYDLSSIQRFYQKRGYRDIGIGGWQKSGEHACTKTAHYITPVKKNVLGPREAYTEEESICMRRHAGGFIVKTCAYTRKVPYGGSFHVELTWTATRQSAAQTRLQVVGLFVPEKRMLGVGGIIRKATKEGLEENYRQYREFLLESIASGHHGAGHPSPSGPGIAASRTASAIRKEAAEDLVRNGVFVSWAQLIWALLVFTCLLAAARLALNREARNTAVHSLKADWQRTSALLLARH